MSKLLEWRDSVKEFAKDNVDLQEKLLELDNIDLEFDNLANNIAEKDSKIENLNGEVSKLKNKCWELFEKQTASVSTQKETTKPEQKIYKPEDFIKIN